MKGYKNAAVEPVSAADAVTVRISIMVLTMVLKPQKMKETLDLQGFPVVEHSGFEPLTSTMRM